ncbi:MAG: winged helix-turn-helix domain-containing protein [Candidatus Korobacteraceae bacterium]
MAAGTKILYEFGPFRLDPEKQLLLRDEQPVAITHKTFETLLVLVRHSREVVSKDDLMKELWPDAFVEEANLSQNIFMLRKALGDTPDDRRYIVTLPGKGYRFVAEVREVVPEDGDVIIASRSRSEMLVEQTNNASSEILPALPGSLARKFGWKYLVVIAAVAGLLILAAVLLVHRPREAALGERGSVLIAEFTNTTGDPVFDGTLRQGLAVQLEQSPFLSMVSDRRIQHTLRLMGQPPDARLTPEIAREVCERTGSTAVLDGSIASLGTQYVLGLRAKACRTGDVLAEEQSQAARKEDVLKGLSQMASRFRSRLGESLSTVEKQNTPLAEATTPSLEALKAYSTAEQVHVSTGAAAAVPLLKQAIEIDPQFAMAYARLGSAYGELGESDLSAKSISKAYDLRNRTSTRERFFLDLSYEFRVTGNLERAQQTCESWAQTYPREMQPHAFLSIIYQILGKYEMAVEEGKKAIELDPQFDIGYANLASAYQNLQRLTEAENALQQASMRNLQFPDFSVMRYNIAFLRSDNTGMERAVAFAQTNAVAEDLISVNQGFVLAYSGHLQEARKMSQRAMDLAEQAGDRERAALFKAGSAVGEALFRNASEAKQGAMSSLQLSNDREVEYGAALALARAGDSLRSQALANDLEKRFPEDTSVRFNYLPTLRALVAVMRGEPSRAIQLLEVAVPYELGTPRSTIHGYFGALYPVYVRGEAYLAAQQGAQAVVEFQKILDHRGIVVSDPIGALAYLQLGRAYEMSGDKIKAKSAYHQFLVLWKDADPDIPIYEQAKAEYARLQ